MLRSIKDLIGYSVRTTDGKEARVEDVLFGDRRWRMRYMEIDTGPDFRLSFRYISDESYEAVGPSRFLVAPEYLGPPEWGAGKRAIPARLTWDEVKQCPEASQGSSVEAQYDDEFRRFLGHGVYGERPKVLEPSGKIGYRPPASAYDHSIEALRNHVRRIKEIAEEHVHSAKSVFGYEACCRDGVAGVVSDLILNVDEWRIQALVLDNRKGLASRKYLVEMTRVNALVWSEEQVRIDLNLKEITEGRRFAPREAVNEDGRDHRRFDYCGKPCRG